MMPRAPFKISFQLYTARNFPPQEAVLEGLAEIGYDAVEPWLPDYGDDPKGFRKRIDDAGLACLGFHMPFSGLVEETDRFIDIAHTIGDRPLMIPPFLPPHQRPDDIDGWKRIGERLGLGAERAKASGLRVAWHNHEFEYRLLPDATRPIDHILAAAGDDVGFEVDFAWVTRGWADPVAELKAFAPRIVAIQLKDTAPPGTLDEESGWRATGDGVVDWDQLWPLFPTTAADHLVVEHDRPTDWREVAQRSYDFSVSKGLTR
jgi:sugar phosphate isomerase/epimerase